MQFLMGPVAAQPESTSNLWTIYDDVANLAAVIASDYLAPQQELGHVFQPQDFFLVSFSGGAGLFVPSFSGEVITLNPAPIGSGVTYSGSASAIGNLPAFGDLAGNIVDSTIASDIILQAGFATPDTNENNIYQTAVNLGNANIVAGSNLFVPAAGKIYRLKSMVLTVSTAFSGGSNNSAMIIDIGSTDVITATNTAIKAAAQSYQLGQSGVAWTGVTANITNANPLKLKVDASSDYTSGIASIEMELVRIS